MLEMLLFCSALFMILIIGLYFIEAEPYRKKGLIQRIGELLFYSHHKIRDVIGDGLHYWKIKKMSGICDYNPKIFK